MNTQNYPITYDYAHTPTVYRNRVIIIEADSSEEILPNLNGCVTVPLFVPSTSEFKSLVREEGTMCGGNVRL